MSGNIFTSKIWRQQKKVGFKFSLLLLALLTLHFCLQGIQGVRFRAERDETVMYLSSIYHAMERPTLLPRRYEYGPVNFYLGLIALTPELAAYPFQNTHSKFSEYFRSRLTTPQFLFRVRRLIVMVSALTIIWVYLAVWFWRENHWEALLAASLVALSPEALGHARKFRADTVLMQFGALCFFLLSLAQQLTPARRWLKAAAISAGLAAGTKYPGGALLLPVLIGSRYYDPHLRTMRWESIRPYLILIACCLGTFLLVTPGVLLDSATFYDHLKTNADVYAHGSWYQPGLVERGFPHLKYIFEWFSLFAFSADRPTSQFFALLAGLGVVSYFREDKSRFWALLVFILIYVGWFMRQVYMFPRNYQILIPVSAILSARGGFFLLELMGTRKIARRVYAATIIALLLRNAVGLCEVSVPPANTYFHISDLTNQKYE